jgi:hypothetical protein
VIAEPWNTLLFLIVVPLLVQGVKWLGVYLGKPVPVIAVQFVAAALSGVFVYLNGGFAGLELPVYAGDIASFVSAALTLLVAAWGPIELLYRIVFKAIYEKIGLG